MANIKIMPVLFCNLRIVYPEYISYGDIQADRHNSGNSLLISQSLLPSSLRTFSLIYFPVVWRASLPRMLLTNWLQCWFALPRPYRLERGKIPLLSFHRPYTLVKSGIHLPNTSCRRQGKSYVAGDCPSINQFGCVVARCLLSVLRLYFFDSWSGATQQYFWGPPYHIFVKGP